jgi:hypothetical protein
MAYLKEHRPILYTRLILKEEMYAHCSEIDETATMQLIQTMTELSQKDPPPDKAADPMAWTAHMNSLKAQAEEIILTELIFS